MKKMIFAVLAMLMVAGSAFCQTAYEKEVKRLLEQFVREAAAVSNNYELINAVNNWARSPAGAAKDENTIFLAGLLATDNSGGFAKASVLEKYEKGWENAKKLMTPAEKAKAEKEAAAEKKAAAEAKTAAENTERLEGLFPSGDILADFKSFFYSLRNKEPRKDQFETTQDFEKRKDLFFKDSSKIVFESTLVEFYGEKIVPKNLYISFGEYNADKGEFGIWFLDSKSRVRVEMKGVCKVPPQTAKKILEDRAENIVSVRYNYDYCFYKDRKIVFRNMVIFYQKFSDDEKEFFPVLFDNSNTPDTEFKGSDFWPSNPYAKNLSVSAKEIGEKYKEEQKKAQEQQENEKRVKQEAEQAKQEAEQEAERVKQEELQKQKEVWKNKILAIKSPKKLIFKSRSYVGQQSVFEVGQQYLTSDLNRANEQLKAFEFVYKKGNRTSKIQKIVINADELDSYFGILDVE